MNSNNKAAIQYVEKEARLNLEQASQIVKHVCYMSSISNENLASLQSNIKSNAHVALHFHPDRLNHDGLTVIESLTKAGRYLNQFESNLSNGLLAPFAGSARMKWEEKMFENAYGLESDLLACRPKYGSLNLLGACNGPSPRFGSCYFVLNLGVTKHCTFTYKD